MNQLTVTVVMRAEGQEFKTVGTSFKRANNVRRDSNGIERPHIYELIIELHPALASENYVHLLGTRMPVRKR